MTDVLHVPGYDKLQDAYAREASGDEIQSALAALGEPVSVSSPVCHAHRILRLRDTSIPIEDASGEMQRAQADAIAAGHTECAAAGGSYRDLRDNERCSIEKDMIRVSIAPDHGPENCPVKSVGPTRSVELPANLGQPGYTRKGFVPPETHVVGCSHPRETADTGAKFFARDLASAVESLRALGGAEVRRGTAWLATRGWAYNASRRALNCTTCRKSFPVGRSAKKAQDHQCPGRIAA